MATAQSFLCSIMKIFVCIYISFDTPTNVLIRVVKKVLYAKLCCRKLCDSYYAYLL